MALACNLILVPLVSSHQQWVFGNVNIINQLENWNHDQITSKKAFWLNWCPPNNLNWIRIVGIANAMYFLLFFQFDMDAVCSFHIFTYICQLPSCHICCHGDNQSDKTLFHHSALFTKVTSAGCEKYKCNGTSYIP